MVRDLTIDVGVMMAASGLGALEFANAALDLAKRVESDPDSGLALDERGRIEHQYRRMMRAGTFGHAWLARLASKGKLAFVGWRRLPKGTIVALQEAHFDPEDFKYVETAAHTRCKVLVSHDRDYSPAVRRALRPVSVSVVSAEEACPGLPEATC